MQFKKIIITKNPKFLKVFQPPSKEIKDMEKIKIQKYLEFTISLYGILLIIKLRMNSLKLRCEIWIWQQLKKIPEYYNHFTVKYEDENQTN